MFMKHTKLTQMKKNLVLVDHLVHYLPEITRSIMVLAFENGYYV